MFLQKDVEREPAQEDFIARVGAAGSRGRFTGFFTEAGELALGVVEALTTHQESIRRNAAAPDAQRRAAELAARVRQPVRRAAEDRLVTCSRALVAARVRTTGFAPGMLFAIM